MFIQTSKYSKDGNLNLGEASALLLLAQRTSQEWITISRWTAKSLISKGFLKQLTIKLTVKIHDVSTALRSLSSEMLRIRICIDI